MLVTLKDADEVAGFAAMELGRLDALPARSRLFFAVANEQGERVTQCRFRVLGCVIRIGALAFESPGDLFSGFSITAAG
jgi:hypothetical protein